MITPYCTIADVRYRLAIYKRDFNTEIITDSDILPAIEEATLFIRAIALTKFPLSSFEIDTETSDSESLIRVPRQISLMTSLKAAMFYLSGDSIHNAQLHASVIENLKKIYLRWHKFMMNGYLLDDDGSIIRGYQNAVETHQTMNDYMQPVLDDFLRYKTQTAGGWLKDSVVRDG